MNRPLFDHASAFRSEEVTISLMSRVSSGTGDSVSKTRHRLSSAFGKYVCAIAGRDFQARAAPRRCEQPVGTLDDLELLQILGHCRLTREFQAREFPLPNAMEQNLRWHESAAIKDALVHVSCVSLGPQLPVLITFCLLCSEHRCRVYSGSSTRQASWSPGFPSSVPCPNRVRNSMPQNCLNITKPIWIVIRADPVTYLEEMQNVSGMAEFFHISRSK